MMNEGYKKAARHSFRTAWDTTALGLLVGLMLVIFSDEAARWLNPRPVPYENVQLSSAEWDGNILRIEATYHKTDAPCELASLVVYGVSGVPRIPLDYQPIRATGQTAQRDPGYQVMRLAVDTEGERYLSYQIVTQHLCQVPDDDDGDERLRVSNVFLEVPGHG